MPALDGVRGLRGDAEFLLIRFIHCGPLRRQLDLMINGSRDGIALVSSRSDWFERLLFMWVVPEALVRETWLARLSFRSSSTALDEPDKPEGRAARY